MTVTALNVSHCLMNHFVAEIFVQFLGNVGLIIDLCRDSHRKRKINSPKAIQGCKRVIKL